MFRGKLFFSILMCFNFQMKIQRKAKKKPSKRKRRNTDDQVFSLIFIMEKVKYIYKYRE